jgi:MinD-like ATPase involved in chromosome partitioning or flagellar assembly
MKEKVIALHSSRGGTGKTTIATNLAINYLHKGLNIALLDLDFRAPSLFSIFSKRIQTPVKNWLNDFMLNSCTLEEALIDASEECDSSGKLLLGLANPALKAIRNMTGRSRAWEVSAAKKLFAMRTTLFDDMHIDCCILDTSPGIQYSSINAVVSSDVTVIVATLNPVDIKGVKNMLAEFYDEFEKKVVILINKVFPQTRMLPNSKRNELADKMEKTFEHPVIGTIPCYCDVLEANRGSFLVVEQPYHPFLKDLEEVAKKLENI